MTQADAASGGYDLDDDPVALLALLNSTADIITVVGADKRLRFVSDAFTRVLGYDRLPEAVPGFAIHPDDVGKVVAQFDAHLEGRAGDAIEYRVQHADGHWVWLRGTTTNLLSDPHVRGIVTVTRDISARKAAQEQVRHLTSHDGVTGLPNRGLLIERLREILAQVRWGEPPAAVFVVDIHRLSTVNDRLGYARGDEVLKVVASRLVAAAASADSVYRYGDHFVVTHAPSESVTPDDVLAAVRTSFSDPILIGEEQVLLSATVGVHAVEYSDVGPHQALALAVADTYDKKRSDRGD